MGIVTVYQDLALSGPGRGRKRLPRPRDVRKAAQRGPPSSSTRPRWNRTPSSFSTPHSLLLPSRTFGCRWARSPVASVKPSLSPVRFSATHGVVLLDEPTAALGVSQTEQVLLLIKRLRERGLGVVVISHNLENVFAVADRIIVLRLGPARRHLRRPRRQPRGRRLGDHRGRVRRGSRPQAPGGERMSAERDSAPLRRRSGGDDPGGRPQARRRARPGTLLVLLMVGAIWTFFQFQNDRFLSPGNLTNLLLQQAAVATISIGVVLILLLGEIDLSVGAVSGLCASVMAVLVVNRGRPRGARRGRRAGARCADRAVQRVHDHAVPDPLVRGHAGRLAHLGRIPAAACSARPERSTSTTSSSWA